MSLVVDEIVIVDEWRGLYSESWKGVIVDDAFAHPAKFSRALIRKIYDHVIAEGWATKGSSVVDPFGGVALGGFDAMRHGLNWTGCELEAKFVSLGGQNIALWNERFSRMPNWGTARLIQGDSRKLQGVIRDAACCVSSPPYADGCRQTGGEDPKPHYIQSGNKDVLREYGSAEGQLGAMKEGDHSIVISSPPYIDSVNSHDHGIDWSKVGPATGNRKRGKGSKHEETLRAQMAYTENPDPANLGAMPEGQLCVTSPPFMDNNVNIGAVGSTPAMRQQIHNSTQRSASYGVTEGQLGNESPNTFWSASRLILEQLHRVLTPNAHAVFVVKAFVRDKKIVDFPAQWAQLCEAVGFRLLHDHHALLTEKGARQPAMDDFDIYGDTWRMVTRDRDYTVARKSFFRRLSEAKGSPRIDYENVLCFEKAK